MSVTPSPAAPGLASRRTGGKIPPKLPMSIFAGASAPLSADPTTVHPSAIIDANVAIPLDQWMVSAGEMLHRPVSGVVLSLATEDITEDRLQAVLTSTSKAPIQALIIPTHLADRNVSKLPDHIVSTSLPVALSISYTKAPHLAEDIKLALSAGHVVDLDIPWNATQAESESEWDGLEETVAKAVEGLSGAGKPKAIVIGNLLPPPHSLTVPIVKLLSHPTYQAYQAHISTLSFIPNVYLKFIPPSWQETIPPSPAPGSTSFGQAVQGSQSAENNWAKEEWKRRVKMYLGPALDAFGFSRIVFGTSPSPSSTAASTPHDWYVLAREVVAELAIDQEGVDVIFGEAAKAVYS